MCVCVCVCVCFAPNTYIEKDDGKNAALEIYIPELRIRNANVSLAI